jgi:hypothetical protein
MYAIRTYFVQQGVIYSSEQNLDSLLMVLATQLNADLYAGSWVTCHSLLNLRLCFRLSRPGRSLLRFKSVILLVDSLYTKAIEAVKSQAALSASSPELVWIRGEALKLLPICEFVNQVQKIPRSNMIQEVENDW